MPWNLNGNTITDPNWFLGTQNSDPLIIKTDTNAAGVNAEVMRITPSSGPGGGLVGIGTTAPIHKLHVESSVGRSHRRPSAAVLATHTGLNGNGIIAIADNGSRAHAVWGLSANGDAGHFDGNVVIFGTTELNGPTTANGFLSKPLGGFKIDHPLDPRNKILFHSFVESPDVLNVYSGNVTTDESGSATVPLPDYFEELNEDFRYQLTVIGEMTVAIVAEEIKDNQFAVRTERPNVKVSWQVTGVRKDPYATMYRVSVEQEKPPEQRGTYLYPEAYGQPKTDIPDEVNAKIEALQGQDDEAT